MNAHVQLIHARFILTSRLLGNGCRGNTAKSSLSRENLEEFVCYDPVKESTRACEKQR